jgi:hypothetical protein
VAPVAASSVERARWPPGFDATTETASVNPISLGPPRRPPAAGESGERAKTDRVDHKPRRHAKRLASDCSGDASEWTKLTRRVIRAPDGHQTETHLVVDDPT